MISNFNNFSITVFIIWRMYGPGNRDKPTEGVCFLLIQQLLTPPIVHVFSFSSLFQTFCVLSFVWFWYVSPWAAGDDEDLERSSLLKLVIAGRTSYFTLFIWWWWIISSLFQTNLEVAILQKSVSKKHRLQNSADIFTKMSTDRRVEQIRKIVCTHQMLAIVVKLLRGVGWGHWLFNHRQINADFWQTEGLGKDWRYELWAFIS